ncbi:MAG: 4Fe-4S binding protein [Candidatus Bathyarchaeota archaeon]|nr:4Fe-4S binding protein [Candidatus Bathyarchaeota archaeon]
MQKDKIKQELQKYNTYRRIVQFLSFIFFSAVVFNLGSLPLLLPVLWTRGLEQNTVGDALTAIQLGFYEVAFPWLALASFLITGVLIGKSLCGWVCPFGFIQELVGFIKRKKREVAPRTHDTLLYGKYLVLVLTLFISVTFSASKLAKVSRGYENALGVFARIPFTAISPAETLFATLPQGIRYFHVALFEKSFLDILSEIPALPALFWAQLVIMILVLVFAALVPRGWCRYICPHGAFMAVMNRFSFLGMRRDPVKCAKASCRDCVAVCPMRVPILELPWEKFSHPECIYCMKCADVCREKAIRIKYP